MSSTLGEKLRQAREERGLSLGEVAEQTRISSLYLESIENDDYRTLPGGIFNKGFVKSYAKFVGINEQEALADYAGLMSSEQQTSDSDLKVYRPQVLTDDRSGSSMAPTIILAIVILAIMTAGILFLLNYMRQPADVSSNTTKPVNSSSPVDAKTTPSEPAGNAPDMSTVKIDFKAVGSDISISATTDGKKISKTVIAGSVETFEPKESLKISYAKALASSAQLSINGKAIQLPAQPLDGKRPVVEFEINKANLEQIWNDGAISKDVPAAAVNDTANTPSGPPATPAATPVRTPTPKVSPTAAAANKPPAAATPKPSPKPSAKPATTRPPAANTGH